MNSSPVAPSSAASNATTEAQPSKLSPALFGVALLLAISVLINYVDRGTLAIAAPQIKEDLHLSPSQLGILLSAFFWTYAPFQVVSGWLVDKFNVNWLLALGLLVWSLATLTTGLLHGFALMFVVRLILGIGESVSYPSYNKIVAKHFQESLRGRVNGMVSAGWAGGPALGTLVGGLLVAHVGWRLFFIVLGSASLLWLPAWIRKMPQGPGLTVDAPKPAGIFEIVIQRSAWGTFIGLFSFNYIWYFQITWLPYYLEHQRGFSVQTMSLVGGGAFVVLGISSLFCGWLADRWIVSTGNPTRVLKAFCGGGLALSASAFFAVFLIPDHTIAMVALFFSCASLGLGAANLWTMTQILAGPQTAGRWTGLQNFCGNIAGMVAPALVGIIVERTGGFFWAFAMTSAVSLLGAAGYIFVVDRVQPVQWAEL
jgi:ACS family D-galactonate transporter-like MFS transporter